MVVFTDRNIFDFTNCVDAIVNPVNCVGQMGKGLALEFKKRYPRNFEIYKQACDDGLVTVGSVFWESAGIKVGDGPSIIANFPTKKHWANPSRIDWIESGLLNMAKTINHKPYAIRSIAIPALGCGLGGLDWADVKKLMVQILDPIDNVLCIVCEPKQNN